jgi:hypothetical protein
MKRKVLWLALVTLLLIVLVGARVAQAQDSANYNLTLNSWAGGNYGGGSSTSASYTLILSQGSAINVHTSSGGYALCSGFICQSDKSFFQMRIPALQKAP